MERDPLSLKVAHVGDVAGVGSALVGQARVTGHHWLLRREIGRASCRERV